MLRASLLALALLVWAPPSLSPQTPTGSDATTGATTLSLLPGDLIAVRIWREEDLSGQFQVDSDGFVVLPLLGRKRVVGVAPDSLRDQLTRDYDEFLVNPSVDVTLLRRVTVSGEVRAPGNYPVDATVSLAQLIALAQGVTSDGDVDNIRLIRDGQVVRRNLSTSAGVGDTGIRSGDLIDVGRRGWFSRNLSAVIGLASIVSNIVTVIIVTS